MIGTAILVGIIIVFIVVMPIVHDKLQARYKAPVIPNTIGYVGDDGSYRVIMVAQQLAPMNQNILNQTYTPPRIATEDDLRKAGWTHKSQPVPDDEWGPAI